MPAPPPRARDDAGADADADRQQIHIYTREPPPRQPLVAEILDAAAAAMDASGASGQRVEGSEAGREAIAAEQRERAGRGVVGKGQPRGRDVSTEKRHGGLSSTKTVDNGLDAGKDVVCRSKASPNDSNGIAAPDDLPVDARRTGRSGSKSSSPRRFNGSERRRLSTTKPNEDQQPLAVAPQRGDDDVDDLHQTNPGSSPQSTRRRVSYTRPGTTTTSAASVIAAATAPLPSSSRSARARAPSEPASVPVIVAPRTLPSWSTDPDAGTFAHGGLLLRLEGLAAQLSAGASASGRSSSLPDVRTYGHGSAGASPRASKGRRRSDLAEAPRRRDGPGAAAGNAADKSSSKRKKQTGASADSSRIRHKHSSSLRRAYTLPALSKSNASLLSVFSELTQSSESTSTSSGSNSTVTQQSYERSPVTKRQRPGRKDGDGSDSCRPKHSVLREASSSKLAGEGGANHLKRQGRSSNPLARGVVEPSPSSARAASKHALMAGTATTNAVSVEKTTTPRPVSVVRHSVSSDSDISLRGSGPNTGDRNKMATTSGESETAQEMQDDEDRERELAIQRLVREIAQSPQLMAGADARLHKMMEQEEQLRLHIKQTSPEHPMPRDEPHFRRRDDGEGAFGPFPCNCSSSRTQQGARGGCCEDPPGRPALVPASDPSYYAGRAPAHSQYQPLAEHFAFSGGAGQQQHYQADLADFGRTTISGYEKIALKLAEGPDGHPGDDDEHDAEKGRAPERHVRPLYRRFEYLQHRILLHIQDELSEMEEKLGEMDKWIAEQSTLRDQQGMAAPASRRLEARYGNDVHARRTLLLGDIYVKLGQYNSAMTAYANLGATLVPAAKSDIAAYESWMVENAPVDDAETRFLARHRDLGRVSLGVHQRHGDSHSSSGAQRRHAANMRAGGGGGGDEEVQYSALWGILVLLLLPLVTFSQSRAVIVVAAFAAAAVVASSSGRVRGWLSWRELVACGCTYFALMAAIAILFEKG